MSKLPGEWKTERNGAMRYKDADGFVGYIYGVVSSDWAYWWVNRRYSRAALKHNGPTTFEEAKEQCEAEIKKQRKATLKPVKQVVEGS